MNKRIAEAFANGKAFIPFLTCGDPSLEVTEQLISMLVRTQTNEEFLIRLQEWLGIWEKEGYRLTQGGRY